MSTITMHFFKGERLVTYNESSIDDINTAVQSSQNALPEWRNMGVTARGLILRKAAEKLRQLRVEVASAEVLDTGKPLWEAQADVDNCADVLDFYGGLAPTLTGQYAQLPNHSFWYTVREPYGLCGAIGAWNYPIQMAVFKSAPALLCGNTVIFKPAPSTPTTAAVLAEIYRSVGIPSGVFSVLQGGNDVGKLICEHEGVAKLSFTGSSSAGSLVMRAASTRTIPVTLEMGGKSPLLIFSDANLDEAVKGAMLANFLTQGQVCSNAARVFVERPLLEKFTERLLAAVAKMQIGDPFDRKTTVGSMISPEHGRRVMEYITSARSEGARVLIGGERVKMAGKFKGGFFIAPTVLDECHDEMRVVREEIFGPVLTLLPFDTEKEAVERANATEFGLAGGLFTQNVQRAHRVAEQMQAGSLYVNNYNILPPGLAFGGMKRSGLGRENAAADTLASYTQIKSVYMECDKIDYPFPYPETK